VGRDGDGQPGQRCDPGRPHKPVSIYRHPKLAP
jgi:hypothetical protein